MFRTAQLMPSTVDLLTGPPIVDLWPVAARQIGMGRTTAYELARRGEFPVTVLKHGNRYKVRRADLLAYLGIQEPAQVAR